MCDEAAVGILIQQAFAEWTRARQAHPDHIPVNSAPILWFGNLVEYCRKSERILTVGVNPGPLAFPPGDPWHNYPTLQGHGGAPPPAYQQAMAGYFDHWSPMDEAWFEGMAQFLRGALVLPAGANPYAQGALHTDLWSPLTTNPTWSLLPDQVQLDLAAHGVELWVALVVALQPKTLVFSISAAQRQAFLALPQVRVVDQPVPWQVSTRTQNGTPRAHPWIVLRAELAIGRHRCEALFVPKRERPFGGLDRQRCHTLGTLWRNRPPPTLDAIDGGGGPAGPPFGFGESQQLVLDSIALSGVAVKLYDRASFWSVKVTARPHGLPGQGHNRRAILVWHPDGEIGMLLPDASWTLWTAALSQAGIQHEHDTHGAGWERRTVTIAGLDDDQLDLVTELVQEALLTAP